MTNPAFDLSRLSLSDLDAELAERRFYDFIKASWRVLHPAQPFVDGWHIGAMAEHLEALVDGQIKNLLINIAVKMTKSIVASVDFPAWVWGPRRMPSTSWLYTSHSIKLASEHSLLCRRLI